MPECLADTSCLRECPDCGLLIDNPDVYPVDECQHAAWRWLDCEACRDNGEICDVKVCVECGSSFMGEEA